MMEREHVEKLLAVQDAAMKDDYYLSLLAEYRVLDKRFLGALEEMAPVHRDIVMDYMGCVHAIHQRMLELSCALGEKS